jgi:putative SOS response-associated peptidase YedK
VTFETFTIVTTTPNALMAPLHDRMPVIVAPGDWDAWLDAATPQAHVESLIRPYPGDDLEAYPVHSTVNNPKRDDPALLNRAETRPKAPGLFD